MTRLEQDRKRSVNLLIYTDTLILFLGYSQRFSKLIWDNVIAQKPTNWTNNLGKQSNYVKTKNMTKYMTKFI